MRLPWADLAERTWWLEDRVASQRFERGGDELAADGLYVALDGWGHHFLAFSPESAPAWTAAGAEVAA